MLPGEEGVPASGEAEGRRVRQRGMGRVGMSWVGPRGTTLSGLAYSARIHRLNEVGEQWNIKTSWMQLKRSVDGT